ncbi:chromosome segregation protein SMC [Chitinimonas sp. BJB300]|uniref:chromosome segregation protein SMC n=1 Tax=Chitinimonas sp. BJB300 TaxID=1559339 RepID=UPI000C0CBBB5|nr:chromosome segregation protein SMC [Chitinimonas sp. BJB300]PHV12495.1 chromosome segregation protein SMC [Chitinimonas sp. BJB300]TSJ89116.1 chromosome segregation protein SMC [Chitinimonas sp. BJB300]
MRLTHVKLAGFKSFCDPTAIPVPGQLVAVVGPNGCGKSNVIDAVRWVLGESSAKQLRGESMQDVIFNGSTSRKSVSRASVELVFDNAEGRAAGAWSQYAEISIKRLLTRQGESSYYINNLQCRRRDIADLFLGTGVGTKGYAVIEQGMISRIIEARPEELRAFLEEAAGISKYKERRKETEGRIADTRENLERVDDIRQELTGQLEKLETQAGVAAQFHEMKARLAEKQNLLALQRKLDAERDEATFRAEIAAAQTGLESQTSRLRDTEATIELLREQHYDATDRVSVAQTALADASATVARMEQKLLHLRETRQRLTQQQQQARQRLDELGRAQQTVASEQEEWQFKHDEAALAQEETQADLLAEQDALPRLEADYKLHDNALSEAQLSFSHARQSRQLAEQQLQHLERSLGQLQLRREKLATEARNLPVPDADVLADKRLELEELTLALEEAQNRLGQLEGLLHGVEAARTDHRHELEKLRAERAELSARHDALDKLQAQAGADKALDAWLARQGLSDAPRFFRQLTITPGWETAVEAVLRERMNAVIGQTAEAAAIAPARLTVLSAGGGATAAQPLANTLLQHVHSSNVAVQAALQDWLAMVHCVTQDAELADMQSQLAPGALVVARSGHSASRHAMHFHAPDNALAGVLQREKELADLAARLAVIGPALEAAGQALHAAEQRLGELHNELKHARQKLDVMRQQRGERQVEVARLIQAAEQARVRLADLEREQADLAEEAAELALEQEAVRDEAEVAGRDQPALEQRVQSIRLAKTEAETALEAQRGRLRQAERQAQETSFARQSAHARLAELQRRSQELASQLEEAHLRLDEVSFDLEGIDEGEFDVGFQDAVNQRAEMERQLAATRDAANATTNALREKELEKQQIETGFDPLRERVGELRLKEQEARLALERFEQELLEAQADVAALLPLIGNGLKVTSLVAEIGRLGQGINALGNVNLAALDELNAARERKTYLDAQADDLTQAMDTLESAIRKIDRETRVMLQSTFDAVNGSLQELFPLLFGGGHAELILTGEEILDAGIQIMAQPPGKKNATIHLLSGGEKALTALSLVFSLFQLNPAPFCLLDEVDAPLDDANTGRFCEMVKRMSSRTQFLYISHNKLTMEMADQLIGITMQEQGVSRVVAVDIQEALQMREMSAVQ